MGYGRSRQSSITEAFTLNPLPYPVLFILFVIFIFLAISWSSTYESAVEDTEQSINWVLMATPIILLIAVRWLSSIPDSHQFFLPSSTSYRSRSHHSPSEGSSPWGVAAFIILLLIMVSYQSTFHDKWFPWRPLLVVLSYKLRLDVFGVCVLELVVYWYRYDFYMVSLMNIYIYIYVIV